MNDPQPYRAYPGWQLWRNPIFRRYCQARLRWQAVGAVVLLDLLVAGFIVAMGTSLGSRTGAALIDAARSCVIPLLVFQGIILFVIGTAQASGGMLAERDEGVYEYQRLIPMTPLSKVFGYLFGLPVREYVMFLGTLPFTIWALWQGEVPMRVWLTLYAVMFSSTVLYHFTGLVTGTVVKNRRTAFLVSIGLVFCLYTIIPQAAKFGLVFFKYLTIRPVVEESLPWLLPRNVGAAVETVQRLLPTVKFFNLGFSEAVFTAFTQGGLILTFIMMLRRSWRRNECHLLGKLWATGLFIWVQILLLGNALPLIDPGDLFPSSALSKMRGAGFHWAPKPEEAVTMAGLYGFATMAMLFVLALIITPSADSQRKGWRRALKQGDQRLPLFADASTSFWCVLVMAVAGAVGWFIFTKGLVESKWFPGQTLPLHVLGYHLLVMVGVGLSFQAFLEDRGRRALGFLSIFVAVVPLLVGVVLGTISDDLLPVAVWIVGISPLSMPFYVVSSLLPMMELPFHWAWAMPRAMHFWLLVTVIFMIWRGIKLRAARRAMADSILGTQEGNHPPETPE